MTSLSIRLPEAAHPKDLPVPSNPAPVVVPSLQEWEGGHGSLPLATDARILADQHATPVAEVFAADLAESTGLSLKVVPADGRSFTGDILFQLDPNDAHPAGGDRYAAEGYRLEVTGDGITLTAPQKTGLFYGTRTLLQLLIQAPDRRRLPIGSAVDWPDYASRGFMLDVGRKFFSAIFIRDYIRMMSYFKLNEFQIHLNDNEIHPAANDWSTAYSGFRLASRNPVFAGLASTDGAYTREDWDSFEDVAANRGITIIPEIDGPAHAAAIIQWKPEAGLDGGKSDHLDLSKAVTAQIMKDIFTEFTPWFRSPDVHFGADEYPRELNANFRDYYNAMAEHLRTLNKHPRAWGSFSMMQGNVEGYDPGVTINSWNNSWYGLGQAVQDGMTFINTNDEQLYIVPQADYYRGTGLDNHDLYDSWTPNIADDQTVAAGSPQGAMFAVWNDLVHADYTELDVDQMVAPSFPTLAQKMWKASAPDISYAEFVTALESIGRGPGLSGLPPYKLQSSDRGMAN